MRSGKSFFASATLISPTKSSATTNAHSLGGFKAQSISILVFDQALERAISVTTELSLYFLTVLLANESAPSSDSARKIGEARGFASGDNCSAEERTLEKKLVVFLDFFACFLRASKMFSI